MASLLFVLEPIELCGCSRPPDSASLLDSKGQGAWRQGPSVTNAGAWPCCCMLLQRGRPCLPASRDVCRGPVGLHTRRENPKPMPSPPLPTPQPLHSPPHPHHPFRADPFSRSFRGPIKRLAHSVHSKMCNVRESGVGEMGDGEPEGGVVVRFQKGLESPSKRRSSWTSHSATADTKLMSRIFAQKSRRGQT